METVPLELISETGKVRDRAKRIRDKAEKLRNEAERLRKRANCQLAVFQQSSDTSIAASNFTNFS